MRSKDNIKPDLLFCGPFFADHMFSGLTPAAKRALAAAANHVQFPAGSVILQGQAVPAAVYILRRGFARISAACRTNVPETARNVQAGEVIALPEAIAELPFPMDLTAMTACSFDVIEIGELKDVLLHDPHACLRIASVIAVNYHKSFELLLQRFQ